MSEQIVDIAVSHTVQQVTIVVTPPVQKVVAITVTQAGGGTGEEPLFLAWKYVTLLTGERKSGVDAGVCPSFSFTDDYMYVCVKTGDSESAIWKKTLLFHT